MRKCLYRENYSFLNFQQKATRFSVSAGSCRCFIASAALQRFYSCSNSIEAANGFCINIKLAELLSSYFFTADDCAKYRRGTLFTWRFWVLLFGVKISPAVREIGRAIQQALSSVILLCTAKPETGK